MKFLCKIFGHKMPQGYMGDAPYGRPHYKISDYIGREHWVLKFRCARCNREFAPVKFHGPLKGGDA